MTRHCKHIIPVLVAALAACQRQEPAVPEVTPPSEEPETPALVEYTLHASLPGGDGPESRTHLDASKDTKVLWSAEESISVFYGGENYQFTGTNTTAVATADFKGKAPAGLESGYVALYPYNSGASYESNAHYISTRLSPVQTGKAGSFGDGHLITVSQSSGSSMTFDHVCSGLRFKVSRSDIKKVTIRGNKGEKIAGDFSIDLVTTSSFQVREATKESVTLEAPDGGTFVPGTYYYIIILPTVFSKGFTLYADTGTQCGEIRLGSTNGVTFLAGKFKTIDGNLDERVSWSKGVYYGQQNTFCLRPGSSVDIDVTPRYIASDWQRSAQEAGVSNPYSAEVLWGPGINGAAGDPVTVYLYAGMQLTVKAPSGTTGSSLVAIKSRDDTILWSYLIWVTDSTPAETPLPGEAILQEPLGGQLYFQWGRKDPLWSDCEKIDYPGDGKALATSIQYPDKFICTDDITGAANDWYSSQNADTDGSLWGEGGAKTVWDPCPEGWRVPSVASFPYPEFDYDDLQDFPEWGYITENYFYQTSKTYWTRTPTPKGVDMATALDDILELHPADILFGQARYIACPIRCVKE